MWSPWRSRHIERAAQDAHREEYDTLFERLAAEPERDETNLVLWRGETVFVAMNLYPYNNGHLMIAPYRKVADYEMLTPEERTEMAHTVARCIGWLREALNPDGFNVGMNLGQAGGAGIPGHLHQHVVPRWNGDTNFMPTLAEVKVVPEALEETYRKLRGVIDAPID